MTREHDLIVIGLGVGGEEVAGRAAEAGMDVLAVERHLVGGECAYWGCIPTKAMVRASDSVAEALRAARLAGRSSIDTDWAPVAKRVREITGDWDDQVAVERHEKKGATVIKSSARLVGPREVEIDGTRFSAKRGIVIAAGSEPAIPPIDGLGEVDHWTNREAVKSTEVPSSMIVLGGGAIGLELAQIYSRFGCRVTIVEGAPHVLPAEEPENAGALQDALTEEGVALHTGVTATAVKKVDGMVHVDLSDGSSVEGERLLVATGRRTNLRALDVEHVGLDPNARGVAIDGSARAGEGLWAVGDITAVAQFTHIAVYQGRIAAADILEQDHAPADYSAIPRVTFTDPEVASVGLSEARAKDEGIDVRSAAYATSASSRGYIHGPGAEHGMIKLVADSSRGVLVGASIMAPAAGEMLGLLVLAIKEKIPIRALREMIYPYPTFIRGFEDPLRELDGGA